MKDLEKNYKMKVALLKIIYQSYFITFFQFLQFFGLQLTFWPLKGSILKMGIKYELEVFLNGPRYITRVSWSLQTSPFVTWCF